MATGLLVCALGAAAGQATEMIADPGFREGLYVRNRDGTERVLRWDDAARRPGNATPPWHVAQHDSKSFFGDAAGRTGRHTGVTVRDDYQSLDVHPEDVDADIVLGVNAQKEYGGVWRKPGDPWPHLYLQQVISHPGGGAGRATPTVADLERLTLNVSVRLLYDRQHRDPGFDPGTHAAQFQLFLTVQNLNTHSKGFGDYYWFGTSLYDNRRDVTGLLAMQDVSQARKKGTEKFIYDVGLAPFTSEVVGRGRRVTVHGDLAPYVRAGLEECWKRGFLRDSKDPADYRIGGIFLGWEVPGLNDAAMAVKGLSLTATTKVR